MSAIPRTMRAVPMPAALRARRVAGINARPFGTITLFLIATAILGVTSLGYVWQAGQRTAANMLIQERQSQLQAALNVTQALETQLDGLKSPTSVMQAAYARYGMRTPTDPSAVHVILVPGPVTTKLVAVPRAPHIAAAQVHVSATDTAVTTWWQDAWMMLYRLLR